MNAVSASTDEFWDDFLPLVEEKRVIPIVGRDLLLVEHEGETLPYYTLVARRLAERLRVPIDESIRKPNDVVCRFLRAHGRREEIYPRVRAILKELAVELPPTLRALARVRDFDLFLSLTFDSMLVDAINAERFGGRAATEHIGYAPNRVVDLPVAAEMLKTPVVYSLFGKVSVGPDFVITEEDTLEFLHALQSEAKRPHLLFDALKSHHLLLLGCGLPDWLARFFMRTAKGLQLSIQRGESELMVESGADNDSALVMFMESFSYGTRIVSRDPAQFVAELESRWSARNPAQAPAAAAAPAAASNDDTSGVIELAPGGIFLSYAKEDVDAVRRIRDALDALGLEVWFDHERLEAGDAYDFKIKRSIKACSLFLPVISQHTERRIEGYFRREWKLAEERALGIADHVPFILPIVVDDTKPYESVVPEGFQKAQWTKLPDGEMAPEFQMRIVKLVREFRKREKGLA